MTRLMRRPRAIIAALLGALALAVVPGLPAQAAGPGIATFTVTAEGSPVAFGLVSLSGAESRFGLTDASGQVAFTDLALGDYTMQASGGTHQPASVTFALTAEAPAWVETIALQPWPVGTGVVEGTVVDAATGAPIEGVALTLNDVATPAPPSSAHSDADGRFTLTGLVAGTYWLSANSAPGHFSGFATVEVADDATATVELRLLAADAAITGRVVDQDGNGVAGISVQASLQSGTTGGSLFGEADATGYYMLPGAGEGDWEVLVGPSATWERAVVSVAVAAGTTATASDLVLVPRFTGTVSGLVASSDGIPESQMGGFFDVCITALLPDGTPVPGASTVTGGDSFYSFSLAPGDYTVYFEDCDVNRLPRYQSTYLGGSSTLGGATIVTVKTLIDVWLDVTELNPEVTAPEPQHDAVPVGKKALTPATKGLIDAPASAERGATLTIAVGEDLAGTWVSVWQLPGQTQFGGWHQVAADGSVAVEVPENARLGKHPLVVQDADDDVIGWTRLHVRR